jgi:catechol 2,3-dioxygenase-like lactoylglutathione lyase family enzyme
MILHIDHVTVVVRDIVKAKAFFSLLGFVEEKSVVISGPTFARYIWRRRDRSRACHAGVETGTLGLKFSFCDHPAATPR